VSEPGDDVRPPASSGPTEPPEGPTQTLPTWRPVAATEALPETEPDGATGATTEPDAAPSLAGPDGPPTSEGPATPPSREEHERALRARLLSPLPAPSVWGWLGPGLVAVVALVLRVVHLGRPHELVFDETYYVKQAYSLLRLGYEARWAEGADERFVLGDFTALLTNPEYVVHPPVGKWLIALGMWALGPENAAGWRIAGAVIGALTVLILARLARRLFGSTLLGCVAGLLLAVEGEHLVLSRTGILDVFVGFFALAALGAVVLDRERSRARLAERTARDAASEAGLDPWGPRLGVRWWLIAAGVLSGLTAGVKWSGAYVLATLGILTVVWSLTARRAAGARLWVGGGLIRDGMPAFLSLVPVALVTYVATWASWFAHPGAYLRTWAADNPAKAQAWFPDALESLWEYHAQAWGFHTSLSTPHAYMAGPIGWIVQWRPTSFFWGDVTDPEAACGAARCVQAITSVGNPILWWAGVMALVVVVIAAVRLRDWRAWTVLAGYLALWVPWFAYPNRTTFTFYAVALSPFVVLSVTYAMALMLGWRPSTAGMPDGALLARERWREPGPWIAVGVLLLALAAAAFFWPVWTAQVIPYEAWRLRMWMPSWI